MVSQYTHLLSPEFVAGCASLGPNGAHTHFSRERWSDFSCLVQSYFDLNVSVQKVHWKMRFLSSAAFPGKAVVVVVGRRRRLRSFLPAKPELKEPNEPCDIEDPRERAVLDKDELRPEVSREVVDGALRLENAEPLLERLRRPLDGDLDT